MVFTMMGAVSHSYDLVRQGFTTPRRKVNE